MAFNQDGPERGEERVAGGALDADVGGDAGEQQVADAGPAAMTSLAC